MDQDSLCCAVGGSAGCRGHGYSDDAGSEGTGSYHQYKRAGHAAGVQPGMVRSAQPGRGCGENSLYSVAAIGPNDVWAVGSYTGTGGYQTLTEHWDGGQWSIVPSPNPGWV